jgi:hypothetical protein
VQVLLVHEVVPADKKEAINTTQSKVEAWSLLPASDGKMML